MGGVRPDDRGVGRDMPREEEGREKSSGQGVEDGGGREGGCREARG